MKTVNLSIGVYKVDFHESLFLKKDSFTYYDIKERKTVPVEEIDETSLISYDDIFNCHSPFRSNIVKIYDLDRMKKISLNKVFIGNLYQIMKVVDRKFYHGFFVVSQVQSKLFQENLLLELVHGIPDQYSSATFKNMESGTLYEKSFLPSIGDFYIETDPGQIKLFSDIAGVSQIEMNKGKILEKYRIWKNGMK